MNVIVVVIDALRASDVGCLGRDNDTTPHIDALATESYLFEQAFSLSNYTDICMSSLLSGKPPREHGVLEHGTAHTEANLRRIKEHSPRFLPETLHENGYHTIGVDWMGRWHQWGYDEYGVDELKGDTSGKDEEPNTVDRLLNGIKDAATDLPDPLLAPIARQYYRRTGYDDFRADCEDLTDTAIERIDGASAPFFTLLHYWDVHPPYLPPEEYETFEYEGEDEPLSEYFGRDAKGPLSAAYQSYARGDHTTMAESKEAYDGAVAWVDEQLGRLLSFLRTEGLFEETMIVVTADHGHNFGEHGIFSDNCGLYDTSIHVPLVVHHPAASGNRVGGLVQHTDVVPTVLDAADVDGPDDLRGNVLPATREFAFAEAVENRMQMVRTTDWKLIVPRDTDYLQEQYWYTGDGSPELYDLTDDPGETHNVAAENPDVVERLRELLETELTTQEEIAKTGSQRMADIEADDLEEVKERLNALGYADDGNV